MTFSFIDDHPRQDLRQARTTKRCCKKNKGHQKLQQPGETAARFAQTMTKHGNNPLENFQAKSRCLSKHQFHVFSRKNQEMTIFRGNNSGIPIPAFNNGKLTEHTSPLKHGNQNESTREYRLHLDGKFTHDQKPHKISGIPFF